MTVMGDALMDGLSDRGSIPLRSIKKDGTVEVNQLYRLFIYRHLLRHDYSSNSTTR